MPRKGSEIRKTNRKALSWHFRKLPFWDRVGKQTERVNECFIFTGTKDESGYGRIWNRDGKLVRLHRAAWIRDNGEIPVGKVIMHTCDNRACINPEHLKLGTQTENIKDMFAKGRNRMPAPYTFDVVF